MGKEECYISIRAFATQIGVTEGAVRKAASTGKLEGAYDPNAKKINPTLAFQSVWAQKQLQGKHKPGVNRASVITKSVNSEAGTLTVLSPVVDSPVPAADILTDDDITDLEELFAIRITPEMQPSEAMRLREVVGLAKDRMALAKESGALVSRDKVERTLYAYANELKKALQNLPQRVVRDIMTSDTEVEGINILTDALNQVLTEYATFKTIEVK
ncbi:hypothetical protein [Chitinophaga sp. sic0106]|uniref:hypothetical protein n=1 Tax=Chitinophaga sp. sic0106 TaxID=2854785 RepID=UPI001C46166D|nr:hypothetical protein [Chitinophaga sp. sic0106]MBV7529025.1 hypothetical protein [Chitinophaga sp. sic0106]